jgi:phage I-like protein
LNRRGFSLYLTFLISTVIFLLVTTSYEISRTALDLGRSEAIETQVFHAADGGIERGLTRLRKQYAPFKMSYSSIISQHRRLVIEVEAVKSGGLIDLLVSAGLFEGNREVARQHLKRSGIENLKGRNGIGKLVEAT